jgi:hypothetical protein
MVMAACKGKSGLSIAALLMDVEDPSNISGCAGAREDHGQAVIPESGRYIMVSSLS